MIDREPEYDNILNDCLDSVLSGQRTISECLEAYPEHAHLLRPALQVALLAHNLPAAEMPEDRVDALEMRLRGQMLAAQKAPAATTPQTTRPRPVRRPSAFAPFSRLAAMIAIVILFALGTGGGAVAASANSLPGDPLYGLKRLWESIILVLASLGDSVDDVWLHLAQTRLDEAETLAVRGTLNSAVFVDLYEATAQAIILADEDTTPMVVAFLHDAEGRIEAMPTTAATESLRQNLLVLMIPQTDSTGRLNLSPASISPSLQTTLMVVSSPEPTATSTPTATITPSIPSTATKAITTQPSPTVIERFGPTSTPTSRVSATSTDAPAPTNTPMPTATPSYTPTATWTAIPLPAVTITGGQPPRPTDDNSGPQPTRDSGQPDAEATVRFRATQGAVYATQTQQAAMETEEVSP